MKSTIIILSLLITASTYGQLREKFEREAQYQHLSGVILAKQQDTIFFEGCYGTIDGKLKNTLNTRFDIGSITKQFTAAGILHLVKEGKLSLQDPINNYLGDLSSRRWSKVTIHHLLTHTGGVPSLYQTEQGLELFLPEETPISLNELVGKFRDAKLIFSPGKEFNYSNSGYILLAAIIQEISGQTYAEFMQEKIFDRYGLNYTSVGRSETGESALPFYGYRADLLETAPICDVSWFLGSGGVYSTAGDLIKWTEIITGDNFLNSELREKFLKSHTSVGYGYGWQFVKGEGIIQHDGGSAGFISILSFNPESRQSTVILTNRSFEFGDIFNFGKSANYVGNWNNEIWKALDGEEVELLPEYKHSGQMNVDFRLQTGQLLAVAPQDSLLRLTLNGNYPSRVVTNTALEGTTEKEKMMVDIARYLDKAKYWSLAKYCDGEMKFVMYSGLMSVGMRMLKKKVGKAIEFIPYYIGDYGLIRMKGTERILDLIIYFNDEGKLIGVFENGFLNLDKEAPMLAYPTGNEMYYIDGLPYGEESLTVKINNDEVAFYQHDRSVSGTRK